MSNNTEAFKDGMKQEYNRVSSPSSKHVEEGADGRSPMDSMKDLLPIIRGKVKTPRDY